MVIPDVPTIRVRAENAHDVRADGDYVLYWMVAERRLDHSFALDRAVHHANALGKPLVVLEALRVDYPWASARFHAFVLDGMRENAATARARGLSYLPFVEERPGEGAGLVETLTARACVVVTNRTPILFLPRMVAALARRVAVKVEAVDGYGLLPLDAGGQHYVSAYQFRRHLQRVLAPHLACFPSTDPLAALTVRTPPRLPALPRHRFADDELLSASPTALARFPIDASVGRVVSMPGGTSAARARLARFLDEGMIARYADERAHPDLEISTGLSPALHFGHLGAHEIFRAVVERELWSPAQLRNVKGARHGGWGLSASTESFLDQLVTWRELGAQTAAFLDGYDRFEALPRWSRATLEAHARDVRPHVYDVDALAAAATHDPLWNAAQRQLVETGLIHNALRMLWGKKILEWTSSPEAALHALIELNNRYALDGRNPNSYSGIFWTLGRYDRPWAPERPIFGTVRYMSSENSARKWRLKETLQRFGPPTTRAPGLFVEPAPRRRGALRH